MLQAKWIHEQVAGLMAMYTARPPAPIEVIVTVWLDHLGDMSEDEVRAGIIAHGRDSKEGKFWPTPAHIRAQVERLQDAQRRQVEGPTLGPEEEWQKVIHMVRSVGFYRPALAREKLGEDLWSAIGEGVGYSNLCQMESDAVPSERMRFCALRRTQTARAEADRRDGPMLQLLEGGGRKIGATPNLRIAGGDR